QPEFTDKTLSRKPGAVQRDPAGEKSLATSDVAGILNAPALNPLRRVFVFIFNAFEVLDGAGIESKILK
ncbi:hypothetical protein Q0Q88_23250, partial [Escherichia coli O74:H39]